MTDRELVSVFWATCGAIVLIWGIAGLVRLGVDRQERAERRGEDLKPVRVSCSACGFTHEPPEHVIDWVERRKALAEITRLGREIEDDHLTDTEGLCIDPRCMADRPRHSSTAVETADQPSASDSPRRGGGTSFQEQ